MFGSLQGWYTIYTFLGALAPLTEFRHVQNSLCVQVLRSPILAALLRGTPAAGRGARNGIMELSQRAPPIFGRAAIMLGIGPHSSNIGKLMIVIPALQITVKPALCKLCNHPFVKTGGRSMKGHILGQVYCNKNFSYQLCKQRSADTVVIISRYRLLADYR